MFSRKISIIFLVILAILSIIILEAGISFKSDLELMKEEKTLILIIDPSDSNYVEAALAKSGKNETETFYLDPYQIIKGGGHLDRALSLSVPNGSETLIGENLRGINSTGDEVSFVVERVLVVNDSIIQDILNLTGPLNVEYGSRDSVYISREMAKEDIIALMKNEKLQGWQVSIREPITGKTRNLTLSQDEIETLIEIGDFSAVDFERVIKLGISRDLMKKINSKALYDDILKLMLDAYKRGDVFTYPETSFTKSLKHASPFWFK